MIKYEIQLDDAYASLLQQLADTRKVTPQDILREIVLNSLKEYRDGDLTEEFKRLVEESITENEPVLRRLAVQ